MPRSRRSLFLLIPAAILFFLAGWLAGRFWLAPDPQVPSFSPARPVSFPSAAPALAPEDQWRSCHGRVLDPEGGAVTGALVYARIAGVPYWTWSGEGGEYELSWPLSYEEAAVTEVSLALAAFGHPPSVHAVAALGGPADLTLNPREPTPMAPPVAEGIDLRGRLVRPASDVTTRPFAYEIALAPVTPPEVFGPAVGRRVRCEEDGSFLIADLARGEYRVRVLPAWAEGGSWPDVLAEGSAQLDHTAGADSEVRLQLDYGAIFGTSLDVTNAAVEGALVLVSDALRPERLWPPATSDAAGNFDFADMPPGSYLVSVQAGEARLREVEVQLPSGARAQVPLPALQLRSDG